MTRTKPRSLKARIVAEMTVDYANALEKNFDLAKKFIRITQKGRVDVVHKDKLSGKENILLYLVGKLYAREAGFIPTEDVGNKELLDELGIPKGSLMPWLQTLRNENKIKQVKRGRFTHHAIAINLIEKILSKIDNKIKKYI